LEDYERLIDARERADKEGETASLKALATRIVDEATKIRAKYVEVPYTTEFAVLYLPIESLWADVLKIPGLMERVQRETHVTIAGPTVLAALINSLQMGFRTLAIEQKSAEVWHVLGQVKTEFVKFAQAIEGVEKKMDGVRTAIGAVKTRTNVMNRRLQSVEAVRSETVEEQENSVDCS
jgi:DNA recombination protein RmuC